MNREQIEKTAQMADANCLMRGDRSVVTMPAIEMRDLARTALDALARLEDAEAAQALVFERAAAELEPAPNAKDGLWVRRLRKAQSRIRALAPASGVEALAALRAERRMIVSHATMGRTDGEGLSVNEISVRITELRNSLYKEATAERDDALTRLAAAEAQVGAMRDAAQNVVREQVYEDDTKEKGISLRMLWRFTLLQEAAGLIDPKDPFFARAIAEARAAFASAAGGAADPPMTPHDRANFDVSMQARAMFKKIAEGQE